ncbi:HlyD family efflux transporter periplasmic adaptor subunit [Fulvivirga sp. 29W222]|uniref:HlyD family efflux transporter periplasmic adaptor subunit n=1 Tax=Fulvivirga marina TaxID=2494733 RepID=A0A937KCI0_9BACT|nr:HlyD family efflux transporter periplasmic adaptor subunit [Fulvivirga marina]MBL6448171.1 HlyD family efflux transporter periplasmic adaptor subunit [Fulvivirga marina]
MLNLSSISIKKRVKEDELYTLKTLKTPDAGKVLARWLLGFMFMFIVCLFLPWQQNIRGEGKVTALTPENRPQTVESAIAGRINEWKVMEGEFVERGDTILLLSEIKDKYFDPKLLERLGEQLLAKENALKSKKNKAEALGDQIAALEQALKVKLNQTKNKLLQTKLKLTSDSVDFQAEKVRFSNFQNQYERNKVLYEAGNIALTKFQDIESKLQESRMKQVSAENKFLQSKAEVMNARIDITGVTAEYRDKINKAVSDRNATLSEVYESEAEISKLKNEIANMQIRSQQYYLQAPQSGYIVKALKAGIGETIKEGEPVVSIIPESLDKAVELYVKAMDVPLITQGRKVRIEFDGWPALQFSGWPSVSVGSFGGIVKVIDRMDAKNGKFRILITPDPNDEEWPEQVRLGSGAKGWIMLDDVPIWYEIWRQLNGFPPSLYESQTQPSDEKKNDK